MTKTEKGHGNGVNGIKTNDIKTKTILDNLLDNFEQTLNFFNCTYF